MRDQFVLAAFVIGVLSIGLAIGFATRPGEWYANLNKPSFNPPNWVFAPAWTVIYILIGIAGWLIWIDRPDSIEMKLWFAQMILNFAWSPVFFGLQQPTIAFAIILALTAVVIGFVCLTWATLPAASLLFLPYLAWLLFATALNAAIVALN